MLVIVLLLFSLWANLTDLGETIRYSTADFRPLMIRRRLIWRTQAHLGDPNNWYPVHQLPCAKDRVVFPENRIVFVDRPLAIAELVLPENGEIIISKDGGSIRFFMDDDDDDDDAQDGESIDNEPENTECSQKGTTRTMYFKPNLNTIQPSSWFDPSNWHVTFDFDGSSASSAALQISNYATFHRQQSKSAQMALIPDSEQVPCQRDFVDFPTNGSWRVTIGSASQMIPKLGSLSMGSTYQFRTSTFRLFASSFIGQMLFDIQGYNHMEVEPMPCRASSCACGNDEPRHLKQICMHRSKDCPKPQCADPIKPMGFCCEICASSLLISFDQQHQNISSFIYRSLFFKHLNQLYSSKESEACGVALYTHWLFDGTIQVIISNIQPVSLPNLNLLLAADRCLRKLHQRLTNDDSFRTVRLVSQSSSQWILETSLFDSIVLFILLLVLLLVVIGFSLYTYYHRNRNDSASPFVRFRSAASDVELELDNPGLTDDALPDYFRSAQSTDNQTTRWTRFKMPEIKNLIPEPIRNSVLAIGSPSSSMLRFQYDRYQEDSTVENGNNFENPVFKLMASGESLETDPKVQRPGSIST